MPIETISGDDGTPYSLYVHAPEVKLTAQRQGTELLASASFSTYGTPIVLTAHVDIRGFRKLAARLLAAMVQKSLMAQEKGAEAAKAAYPGIPLLSQERIAKVAVGANKLAVLLAKESVQKKLAAVASPLAHPSVAKAHGIPVALFPGNVPEKFAKAAVTIHQRAMQGDPRAREAIRTLDRQKGQSRGACRLLGMIKLVHRQTEHSRAARHMGESVESQGDFVSAGAAAKARAKIRPSQGPRNGGKPGSATPGPSPTRRPLSPMSPKMRGILTRVFPASAVNAL